jgi:chromosome segregation ATPase
VDSTQQALTKRAAELQKQQHSVEARLSAEQKKHEAALGEVAGAVAGVRNDVGGVKTDVAATKSDLEATKARLESLKGDLGVQSGLIATTREDLEILKHKGDRNYYEFTLSKSKTATPVGTISLQLKKADRKKGRFTLNVLADDKTIEKKDRTLNEPLQFYTGRDRSLYEVVVFEVAKDKVSGYLSTPRNAPQPVLNR